MSRLRFVADRRVNQPDGSPDRIVPFRWKVTDRTTGQTWRLAITRAEAREEARALNKKYQKESKQ